MKQICFWFLLSMLGKHCIWTTLMRPTSVKNLHRSAAKSKLPSTLHGKIRAQVSENPRHFIRQILSGGSYFTQMAHPQGSEIEIPQQKIETSGCEVYSKDAVEDAKYSPEVECSSRDKRFPRQGKGKRKQSEVSESSEEARTPKRKSPNYFVGVRITDPQIHSTAKRIQEKILEASDVDISSTCIDRVKFHVTLMVMCLEDEEAVERAEETLDKLGRILASKLGGREVLLEFQGLSVFGGGRVVFTPPLPSQGLDDLRSIAEETVTQMKDHGIYSTDAPNRQFNPHLTLFKFKDNKELFKQGVRKIKESLYAPFKEEKFGSQKISSLQLCQMGEKSEDGYYAVNKEVSWETPAPPQPSVC